MRQMTFAAACMEYFGKKPGQSSLDFMKEIKELTSDDRAYFIKLFPSVGIEIVTVIP